MRACVYKVHAVTKTTILVTKFLLRTWANITLLCFRWSQPASPFTRRWSPWSTIRRTSGCERLRAAAELKISTPEWPSGPSARPSSSSWSASVRWFCSGASSQTRKPPRLVWDRKIRDSRRVFIRPVSDWNLCVDLHVLIRQNICWNLNVLIYFLGVCWLYTWCVCEHYRM